MLQRKFYKKPPLIEVFAEYFFNEDDPWDSLRVSDFYRTIGGPDKYPTRRDPEPAGRKRRDRNEQLSSPLWQFISAQGERVVQVGRHKLVLNQLPPYYSWEKVSAEYLSDELRD